ncbi:MAG: YciI family protein, partial [Pseudomonadota bacterium]
MTNLPTTPPYVPRLDQTCYLVICRDGSGSAEPRATHLKGHLDHVEKYWTRYVTAGPIRDPGGEALIGSVFLVLANDLEDAKALMEGDPYITCG